MATTNRQLITITGPHTRCASEYGYGDYYTAIGCDDCEHGFICVSHGYEPSPRDLRNLRERATRSIINTHDMQDLWRSRSDRSLSYRAFARAAILRMEF